jgi:hypothetical protein
MRYFFLLLLLGASIAVFGLYVVPRYHNLQAAQAEVAGYQRNLDTAKKLADSRESLIATYRSISKDDLDNLKVLLPDSVNNIRLIIQIDALAKKNGLSVLRSIDYQANQDKPAAGSDTARSPYGEFVISFQTSGQYKNFLSFIADLEQNLRLVDVTSVGFDVPDTAAAQNAIGPTYKVTLKTYWLKQ